MLLFPNAKINIGLYVTERRPDGYHNLETVFFPIPLHDNLDLRPLRDEPGACRLLQNGRKVECCAEDNLVVRVYQALQADFALPGVEMELYKRVPTGAGLGGGSADAASAMKGLNELFALGLTETEMERRLSKLGADCAFFVRNRPAYATGIGDCLTPFDLSLKGLSLVLVKPHDYVSTRDAYAGIRPRPAGCDLRKALLQPVETWKDCVENDFERTVFPLFPRIAALKQTLYDMGALYAAMSGSGSTVFGLFAHPVEGVAEVFGDCFTFQETLRL
ncbi:MAG: 4-(cytidine 5'-diphospho)-2-C-methyl-D-erythritol kinase [Alloprevotella sp.]